MRYLGLDVHAQATVWCLFDAAGQEVDHGKVETTVEGVGTLVRKLSKQDSLRVGQEVGTMSHFVHDVVMAAKVEILSFNAYQLRMIASSRKKTDRRDAYWIAKALQTGMTPHPVYIPTGAVRQLRALLSQRDALCEERKRWVLRARSSLRAHGYRPRAQRGSIERLLEAMVADPAGLDASLAQALDLCQRNEQRLREQLQEMDRTIRTEVHGNKVIQRLMTIPAVGTKVAVRIYAAVGDITRFPNARALVSYAGLAPSVRQSGESTQTGRITREGSRALRGVLVQAGHVLLWRCDPVKAAPLQQIARRIQTSRGRRKVAVVAAARHILRVAFYVLRDGTTYDPERLRSTVRKEEPAAANG